jgi:aminoglycoside phosphotransferase (APT) family kinase protein
MPHGYTNHTTRSGSVVTKAYQGPDAILRCDHASAPALAHIPAASHSVVFVHGDYGPNNLLLDRDARAVTAVVDWEWAHAGDPVEELAWCEWIVRMHHPRHAAALAELFDAYGWEPAWSARQQAMLTQCRSMLSLCERWEPGGPGSRQWRHRLATTQSWTE